MIVSKIGDLLGVVRNTLLNPKGQSRGRNLDSGTSKKFAGFIFRNLLKLKNLIPDV
jgi:hypothetical protein